MDTRSINLCHFIRNYYLQLRKQLIEGKSESNATAVVGDVYPVSSPQSPRGTVPNWSTSRATEREMQVCNLTGRQNYTMGLSGANRPTDINARSLCEDSKERPGREWCEWCGYPCMIDYTTSSHGHVSPLSPLQLHSPPLSPSSATIYFQNTNLFLFLLLSHGR